MVKIKFVEVASGIIKVDFEVIDEAFDIICVGAWIGVDAFPAMSEFSQHGFVKTQFCADVEMKEFGHRQPNFSLHFALQLVPQRWFLLQSAYYGKNE